VYSFFELMSSTQWKWEKKYWWFDRSSLHHKANTNAVEIDSSAYPADFQA